MTATAGPGIALKSEAMGLAVMVELPLVVCDIQRAGPSTGMPTKTEQADLLQVMFGRNSDSPIPIVAPATPAECFDYAIEAWRIALKYVTPVVYLSDAFLATGAEPWKIPSPDKLPDIAVENVTDPSSYRPYARNPETLARMWAVPGTKGLEHRIGNTEQVVRSYRRVLIPEVNLGQLLMLIRARFLIDAVGYDRVRGKPFRIAEIFDEAERLLGPTTRESIAPARAARGRTHSRERKAKRRTGDD